MIARKKRKLLEKNLPPHSLLIIIGKSEILRNGDVFYPFRQDSDFLLLTSLNVPLVRLIAKKTDSQTEWILYSDPITEKEILWGTNRLSYDALESESGILEIRSLSRWSRDIEVFAEDSKKIYIRKDDEKKVGRNFLKHREKFSPLEQELLSLRMVKIPEEIEKMKEAIAITNLAFEEVRTNINSYLYERDIEADIARLYRKHGAIEAYPTIVASGPKACILHSTKYDRKLEPGDLILIDSGAEYEGYAADITRTLFYCEISERKRKIYETVRSVQQEAIRAILPGRTWDEHERVMRDIMNNHLIDLGLIAKNASQIEQEFFSRKYFPHRMSHFLGLDVHDSGERNDVLKPGMVITCEPGIYIKEEGIGIRIEDDICIGENESEILSLGIAK